MRTRSSSNLPVVSPSNPSTSNPKRRNRKRSKQPFILEESPIDTMADQCTMAELLCAPTEGYAEAIVVPLILAEQFELKHSLINMMTLDQFFGFEKDNPHDHISTLRNEIFNFQQRFDETFHEAWDRYKDLLRACPHHGFTELHQLDTFYNALNPTDQDSLNSTAGGNLLERHTQDVLTIIENKSKCLAASGNTFLELKDIIQGYVLATPVNYNQGSGSLPSNTVANPKGELKAITTLSGIVLDGPSVPTPPPFINLGEDEHVEETLTDQDLSEYTIKVPPPPEKLQELAKTPLNENCSAVILKKLLEKLGDPGKFLIPCGFNELKCKALANLGASINLMLLSVWKKLGLPELISTRMTLELANRAIFTPAGIVRDVFVSVGKFTFPADFVIVDYESDPRVPFILGRPFLWTACALIDVHGEEMVLRDDDERLTLNMRHDTSSYSNQPQKESINLINIFNNSNEDFLENLFSTNQPKGGNVLPEKLLDFDSTKDLHPPLRVNPLSGSTSYSSSLNQLLEKFADKLALLPKYDDDLYLKDSIDQSNLANLADNFVDFMPEMFTNEHALDYSSPLIFDEYDDVFKVESDTENVYDDPFDSKGEKTKESKPLMSELDLPYDFLPSEYDSFISKDFSKVDALHSTNNEDKLSTSNASLIADFDPPLCELPFFKEVPSIPGNLKTHGKGFCPPVFVSSASIRESCILI
nr:reverse transcriptase domain-containing protein [Tanacetum cinerariifolium]